MDINMRFGFAVLLPFIFFYIPIIVLVALAIYALILAIKALKIYIYKNS